MTAKQKRFCEEYVIDLNATQAAIRAGYSKRSARQVAERLLTNDDISIFINKLQKVISDELGIRAIDVVRELAALGFYNIQDIIETNQSLSDLKGLDRAFTKPIVGIKTTERWIPMGEETIHEVKTEVRLSDKIAALEKVGKHLGIFEKDNSQKSMKIKVTRK